MDFFGGGSRDAAILAFRETLGKYKKRFNAVTTTDVNKQDTAESMDVIKLIDNFYQRVLKILQEFKDHTEKGTDLPKRPTQDTPFEYTMFTDGKIEYLYDDPKAVGAFLHHLKIDLKDFPFTYNVDVIESYNGIPVEPPKIVSNLVEGSNVAN